MEFLDIGQFFANASPLAILWGMLKWFGIPAFFIILARGLWWMYLDEIRGQYASQQSTVTLAINVPKQTEQTPKAVENIFAHLTGTQGGFGNIIDKYWKGKHPQGLSCEIVSRGGFIQYYIHTPLGFRDTIEASIYAQYPDAEIIEVDDYAQSIPQKYPDEQYDLWGTEIGLAKPSAYPIKTYTAFEHALDGTFKDPLASLLEYLGTLKPGEEAWLQILIMATGDEWAKDSMKEVGKILGEKEKAKPSALSALFAPITSTLTWFIGSIFPGLIPEPGAKKEEKGAKSLQEITPGEKMMIEQIQFKASKPGFASKIRFIYAAPKEVFNKGGAITGVIGSLRQFASQSLNSFKPVKSTKVGADYYRVQQRQNAQKNKIIKAYAGRSGSGGNRYILNTEELATLWHFPSIDVKAALVHRAPLKTAQPPSVLPQRLGEERREPPKKKQPKAPAASPRESEERSMSGSTGPQTPSNLPFI